MYFIAVYAPAGHAEKIKQAMFEAGAGRIGDYACCAWETTGTGQFMPLPGAEPFIGKTDLLEKITENRIEMVCTPECIHEAIAALRATHPYETPAFQVIRLETF